MKEWSSAKKTLFWLSILVILFDVGGTVISMFLLVDSFKSADPLISFEIALIVFVTGIIGMNTLEFVSNYKLLENIKIKNCTTRKKKIGFAFLVITFLIPIVHTLMGLITLIKEDNKVYTEILKTEVNAITIKRFFLIECVGIFVLVLLLFLLGLSSLISNLAISSALEETFGIITLVLLAQVIFGKLIHYNYLSTPSKDTKADKLIKIIAGSTFWIPIVGTIAGTSLLFKKNKLLNAE